MNNYIGAITKEPPNILSILHEIFQDASWAYVLYEWESIIYAIIVGIIVTIIFRLGVRKASLIPTGLQNFLELVTETLCNVIEGILGAEGRKYIPFLGTLFIYIFAMNIFGLIPLMKSPSISLNVTVALAVCVFVYVQYLNIKHMGFKGFMYHLAGSPKDTIGWLMVPLLFPIKLLNQISRPVTLALRLFGNIMGEEVLLSYFTLVGVLVFAYFNLPVSAGIPLQIPFMFLAILTSLMQAGVFTLLSAVYILLSIPHDEHHEEPHSVKE